MNSGEATNLSFFLPKSGEKCQNEISTANEKEKDAIVHNPRGRALAISSPSKRSNVDIVATDMTERMFQ